ncbi:MAG TPA: hypothetical protein VMZ22_07395 [Acidimicrobiales bacterium]|nr:hypothetical protein [Acidimicrobiales bacterium]
MNPICGAWTLAAPLDLIASTGSTRTGAADPTSFVRDGRVWRAAYYGSGPAALAMWTVDSTLYAQAWGAGAADALASVPAASGLADDARGFDPSHHPLVRELAHRRPGVRLVRTEAIFDVAIRAALGQKVTGFQAKRSYQALVRRAGVAAPLGCVAGRPLLLPPTPGALLRSLAGHGATSLGIDAARAATLRELALVAAHLANLSLVPASNAASARSALQDIPGVGEWTANEITVTALGDPDALSVGDYHLKNIVAFALTGAPRGSDDQMVALLEAFRPHRARAARLIESSGIRPPRYGPRLEAPAHVPGPFVTSRGSSRGVAGRSPRSRSPRRAR